MATWPELEVGITASFSLSWRKFSSQRRDSLDHVVRSTAIEAAYLDHCCIRYYGVNPSTRAQVWLDALALAVSYPGRASVWSSRAEIKPRVPDH